MAIATAAGPRASRASRRHERPNAWPGPANVRPGRAGIESDLGPSAWRAGSAQADGDLRRGRCPGRGRPPSTGSDPPIRRRGRGRRASPRSSGEIRRSGAPALPRPARIGGQQIFPRFFGPLPTRLPEMARRRSGLPLVSVAGSTVDPPTPFEGRRISLRFPGSPDHSHYGSTRPARWHLVDGGRRRAEQGGRRRRGRDATRVTGIRSGRETSPDRQTPLKRGQGRRAVAWMVGWVNGAMGQWGNGALGSERMELE